MSSARSVVARCVSALALLWCSLLSTPAHGAGEGHLRWYTLETPRFRVHHPESSAAIAHDVAVMCEQAHAVLSPLFDHAPVEPVDVVIVDDVDTANGSAGVIPRNVITLYAMPPESDGVLGDHDNWMWALILHEYAHILHIDTIRGLPAAGNVPFGKQFAPNQVLPKWLIEGLATWHESARTGGGRVRASLFEMMLREALLDGVEPRIDQLGGYPLSWPHATGWYLFGSHFFAWTVERSGWDAWVRFIHDQADSVWPWGINILAARHLGGDFPTLWRTWVEERRGQEREKAAALEADGRVEPVRTSTDGGGWSRFTTVDATTGRRGWLREPTDGPPTIVVHGPQGSQTVEVEGGGEFAFVPGRPLVVHSQLSPVDAWWTRRDLWLIDLETGARRRLTTGARAREPAVSPDGGQIAWVTPVDGRTELRVMDMATGRVTTLVRPDPWGQIARPAWSPDGRTLAFSWAREGEGRDLWEVDAVTGALRRLTRDRALDIDPAWSPDGQYLLFSSDRTGVFDLYALRRVDGVVRRLTRVRSGVFSPGVVPSADGWVVHVSHYAHDGYHAAAMGLAPGFFDSLPEAPASYERPRMTRPAIAPSTIGATTSWDTLGELRPLSWMPWVASSSSLPLALGAVASGADPAGRNAWTASVAWREDTGRVDFSVDVFSRALPPTLGVGMGRTVQERRGAYIAGSEWVPFNEERWWGALSASHPIRHDIRGGHSVGADFVAERFRFAELPVVAHRPWDLQPYFPEMGWGNSLGLGWSWGNARGYVDSVSAESGWYASGGVRWRSRWIGATWEALETSGLVGGYAPGLASRHALAWRVGGGIASSDAQRRSVWSLGGHGEQDLVASIQAFAPAGNWNVRGWPAGYRSGDRYLLTQVEYRIPVLDVDRGVGTLPFHLGRLHAAFFVDGGDAFAHTPDPTVAMYGVGGELRLSTTLSHFLSVPLRLGIARGIGVGGELQTWLLYGGQF